MRLPDELFWDSTSREIAACFHQFWQREDHHHALFGNINATLYNVQPKDPKKRWKPLTWVDFYSPRVPIQRKRGQSLEEARASMRRSKELLKQGPLKRV